MKKFKYWVSMIVFGCIGVLCIEYLLLDTYYNLDCSPKEKPKTNSINELFAVEALAINGPAMKENPRPIVDAEEKIHSNDAWLLSEKIANNDTMAVLTLKETAPENAELERYREQAYELRVQLIKQSRVRYRRPQSAWGNLVSDTLGVEPYSVLLFEKGLAINAEGRYHFFHKATIEKELKELPPYVKIEILRGIDGHWYPSICGDNGKIVPITYWGEVN